MVTRIHKEGIKNPGDLTSELHLAIHEGYTQSAGEFKSRLDALVDSVTDDKIFLDSTVQHMLQECAILLRARQDADLDAFKTKVDAKIADAEEASKPEIDTDKEE